jgi:hypothetical protein
VATAWTGAAVDTLSAGAPRRRFRGADPTSLSHTLRTVKDGPSGVQRTRSRVVLWYTAHLQFGTAPDRSAALRLNPDRIPWAGNTVSLEEGRSGLTASAPDLRLT